MPSTIERIKRYVAREKLKSVGMVWATGLGVSLAYQWTRPIPTQLKIIHSRVYAQALTLAALGAAALVHVTEDEPSPTGGSETGI